MAVPPMDEGTTLPASSAGHPHLDAADRLVRRGVLLVTLVASCVLGLLTPYLLVVVGMALFAVMLVRGSLPSAYRDSPAAIAFLVAFGVLFGCYALSAEAPADVLLVFNFAMLVLYGPFHALMASGAARGNAMRLANLAAAGTIVAFLWSAIMLYGLGWGRAESPIFGAILLGNTALLLSFLAVIGFIVGGGSYRWLYLLAPVLGIAVIAFTGSRGPLLAVVPLTVTAAWFAWREGRLRARWVLAGGLGLILVGLIVLVVLQSRAVSLFDILPDVLRGGGGIDDLNTNIRLVFWEAGIKAFTESPWIGHGWAQLMTAVIPYLPEAYLVHSDLPQLHNDVVNFAVAAGIVGVATYALILLTPLLGAVATPRDSQRAARLYGVSVLIIAYFFDGLTDLMFGFEFHTAFFVVVTAALLGWCRDPEGRPG